MILPTILKALIPDLGGAIKTIIDNKFPNLEETERQRMSEEVQLQLAQIEVNKQEASHPSLFVAGWRPFIGWACGVVLVLSAVVAICGAIFGMTAAQVAALGEVRAILMPVAMGLLGLGGMRSFEKFKGVARNRL